ncbi:frizzled-1 [Microplitis demolitor]|uniref:frizzled-1 n=1 Tax=Microplitis demolitor TaxID=69319 RepID=UPI0004CD436E|nr:frizzled-1 [Microplitis demolitor]
MTTRNGMLRLVIGISVILGCIITEGETVTIEVQEKLEHLNRCEPININLCLDLSYNETVMPNLFNHQNQEDAGQDMHMYAPLIKLRCSPDIRAFLCSMYVPVCTGFKKAIPPCRSVCKRAKAGCNQFFRNFGFRWPSDLKCSKFPAYNDPDKLCIEFTPNLGFRINKSQP